MGELHDKMQSVEDMMKMDERRQNEVLARMLDVRRAKRKKLTNKLQEVETRLHDNETKKQQ